MRDDEDELRELEATLASFADDPDPEDARAAGRAGVELGLRLTMLGRDAEAAGVYERVVGLTGHVRDAEEWVVDALINWSTVATGALEQIALLDAALERTRMAGEALAHEQAVALWNKAVFLSRLGDTAARDAVYEELGEMRGSDDPNVGRYVALAAHSKVHVLMAAGRFADALPIVVELSGGALSKAAEAAGVAAGALELEGICLYRLGRASEAVDVWDRLIGAFGDAALEDADTRALVAGALRHKATALRSLGRKHAEMQIYDELVERFGADLDPRIERIVQGAAHRTGRGRTRLDISRLTPRKFRRSGG